MKGYAWVVSISMAAIIVVAVTLEIQNIRLRRENFSLSLENYRLRERQIVSAGDGNISIATNTGTVVSSDGCANSGVMINGK